METPSAPETTPEATKTAEERIELLERANEALWQQLVKVDQDFKFMFSVMQNLFGIQFVMNKETKQFGLQIQVPKKEQGKPGLLADLYMKMEKLWKKYGGEIIIPR